MTIDYERQETRFLFHMPPDRKSGSKAAPQSGQEVASKLGCLSHFWAGGKERGWEVRAAWRHRNGDVPQISPAARATRCLHSVGILAAVPGATAVSHRRCDGASGMGYRPDGLPRGSGRGCGMQCRDTKWRAGEGLLMLGR